MTESDGEHPAAFTHLIVVGSSAGGIEALSVLVSTLPRDFPAPVVLAQHLEPGRESHLGEILNRSSTLPVRTLTEHEHLAPGVVFVVPANKDVEITDHDIRLRSRSGRTTPSIDRLFRSAAQVFGERLVAVILTGTGQDGAAGALEVHQAGGTVVIQDPATASFPALPRALSPAAVDFVFPLEEIGPLLNRVLTDQLVPGLDGDHLRTLLTRLRDQRGIDFRHYKRSTIMRRLQRRMTETGTTSIPEYMRILQMRPEEEQALIGSFLVKVTEFFRDKELFDTLREQVLPAIIGNAGEREGEIRMWSAGCATGEEAYSLAILLAEILGDDLEQYRIRVFATDLDSDAVTFARQGLYPASSLGRLSEEMLERHFERVDGGYQIKKRLRALMVFGEHDLAERAPFPRLDLILCRNVLIYFTSDLQRRILQLFAFSLREGGYLILGKSETTSPFPDPFVTDNARLKIYRRQPGREVLPPSYLGDVGSYRQPRVSMVRPTLYGVPVQPQVAAGRSAQQPVVRADSTLLDLPVGVAVVDHRYDIQYINDAGRTFLGIHGAGLGEDLIHQVQTMNPTELRACIDAALEDDELHSTVLDTSGPAAEDTRHLQVWTRAFPAQEEGRHRRVTLTISDVTTFVEQQRHAKGDLAEAQGRREELEQRTSQLSDTSRELRAANQQMAHEIMELRAMNEEFMLGNEELQAAAEEVETLNEELQATNEELETLNEELQATVEELNTTNDDLQARNFEIQDLAVRHEADRTRIQRALDSMRDALVVVDPEGQEIMSNDVYRQLFSGSSHGAALTDASGRPLPEDETPQQRAARGETFRMTFGVTSPDGSRNLYEAVGESLHGNSGGHEGGVLIVRGAGDVAAG